MHRYINICRGLFEKDKLRYAFSIATSILKHSKQLSGELWQVHVGPNSFQ